MAQLVIEPDADCEGPASLGVAEDDSELVAHEVRESTGDAVLDTENVGPTRLSDEAPD